MRGCFVTGTDTGVGKTVVAAAIVAALRARMQSVGVLKPVVTGLDEPPPAGWAHDHVLLAKVAGAAPERTAVFTYGPPVSPHLAEELAGTELDPERLRAAVRRAADEADVLVVEGVGGLMVPLTDGYDVRELARDTGLPVIIAARPGLGTINHTLLTIAAARDAGLPLAGVVMTPWPDAPNAMERSNRETVQRLGEIPVATLPFVSRPTRSLLAQAGNELPLADWLRVGQPV